MALAEHPAERMQRSHGVGRLAVKTVGARTRIDRLHQSANAKIRIPRTQGAALEPVLINTAGGIAGGDTLSWNLSAGAGTETVVTTQACERVYRSTGDTASQTTQIEIGGGASLFWLPQETIVFDGGRLDRSLDVSLAPDATFIGLETAVFGREAMGETVGTAFLRDRWRIRRGGALIHADDIRFDVAAPAEMTHPAILGRNRCYATLVICAPGNDADVDAALARRLRKTLADSGGGATAVAGRVIARFAAPSSYAIRRVLIPVLELVLEGRPLPRVWRI